MELKDVYAYNPETGIFTWKINKTRARAGASTGCPNRGGYLRTVYEGVTYSVARLAWFLYYNEWPKNDLDHINGNRIDNSLKNLRLATRQQNMANKKYHKNSSSNFKGVYWRKSIKKWVASISLNKERFYLGAFNDEIEAARAYDLKAKELFGEYAKLNIKGEEH